MSNPTTPFGWQMPQNTDLVTDLPADFEVFGQAVATSMQDLLGGTTGQVLAKASNADMDFVWSADAAGMTNPMTTTGDVIYSSPGSTPVRLGIGSTGQGLSVVAGIPAWTASATSTLTTTGDMLYASAANTLARTAIGSTGNVLTVAGGVPTWAAPAGGGSSWSLFNAGGTALSGNTTTVTGISGVDKILVVVSNYGSNTASDQPYLRFNSNTNSVYRMFGGNVTAQSSSASYAINNVVDNLSSITKIICGNGNADQQAMFATSCLITGANSSGFKQTCLLHGSEFAGTSTGTVSRYAQGIFESSATISSVTIGLNSGNFDSGSIFIYTSVS